MGKHMARVTSTKRKTKELVLLAHNIRSAHNVGSFFRSADAVGVSEIVLSGYSPRPASKDSLYKTKAEKMVAKTALGAEDWVLWRYERIAGVAIRSLKDCGYMIVALEQTPTSMDVFSFSAPASKIALLVGNEPRGIDRRTIALCDACIEIPMYGKKESLNVSVAAGIALYALRG